MPAKKLNLILEVEVKHDVSRGVVTGVRVIETADGFQLVFGINHHDYYLATRSKPDTPRLFKDFERMTALIRTIYPDGLNDLRVEHEAPYVSKRLIGPKLLASKKKTSKKKSKAKAKSKAKK